MIAFLALLLGQSLAELPQPPLPLERLPPPPGTVVVVSVPSTIPACLT